MVFSFALVLILVAILAGWGHGVVWVVSTYAVADVGLSYIRRAGWTYASALYRMPPVPQAEFEVRNTDQGVPLEIAKNSNCFWTPGYCTPEWNGEPPIEPTAFRRVRFSVPH